MCGGRDISQGNAAGWPGSTRTPAQLESPACGPALEQEQVSSSEAVLFGGLLPEQCSPAVSYRQSLNIEELQHFQQDKD